MSLPAGPRLPRALQAVGWMQRPLAFLERCQRRYGSAFTLRIQHWGDWVVLSDPEDVKGVFTAGEKVGVDSANPMLEPVLGPRSVMLLEEPDHLRRRKLMLPPFHRQSVAGEAEMITAVARREVGGWPLGEPFQLWPRMQAITQEVVMRAVFGPDEEGRLDRLRGLLTTLTEALNDPGQMTRLFLFGPRWVARSRRFRAAMEPVEVELMAEVRRRRAAGELRPDIVSMLVFSRDEDGRPLSEAALRDELMTLLTDGPTSSSLAWTFERLLRHPEKLARTQAEARDGDGGGEYIDAVIKETLRLRPPVPVVVRRLREPMRLGGHELPAGTTVAPCVHLIHRDASIYPRPLHFEPERFLDRPTGTYTWIPFGGGVRRCLAASYAELEMQRVMRAVLREVELRPVGAGSERMTKSAIAFSPDKRGLVVAAPA